MEEHLNNADQTKRLVLVVDDEEINRELLGNILQQRYRVEFAADGVEALQVIRRDRNVLSAVLLDLSMPRMDGFEVLRQLRTDDALRHIPVMVLTAQRESEVETLEIGASDFITKPFELPELILARVAKTIRLAEDTYIIRETEKDALTGLPNLSYFKKLCELEKARFAKGGAAMAYVYLDVMNMKAYNARYSYSEGDKLLTKIAALLQECFLDMPVCRISDDHFAVMVPQAQLTRSLEQFLERAKNAGKGRLIEVHAGVFNETDEDGADAIAAIDRAHLACSSITNDYSTSVSVFDGALLKKYNDEQHVLEYFEQVIAEHRIKVHYQPIVRAITGEVCNFEALARWEDPVYGQLSPGVFIPVLEDYKLGARMDLYMVEEVCREAAERTAAGITQVPVSVNFSRTDFDQCDMVEAITQVADKYAMPHDMLVIEVTESAFGHNPKFLQEQIERFHERGFKVWMDDFGDGYASLNVLQDNDFDLIKLDIGFMRKFDPAGKNGHILRDIIKMAQHLGIHTLSEGAERPEQVEFLREIGCEKVQGFFYGKPRPTSASIENVRNGTALPVESRESAAYYENAWGFGLEEQIPSMIPGALLVHRAGGSEEILFANKELVDMFGCASLADFLSFTHSSFRGMVHPDDAEQAEASIARQMRDSGGAGLDYASYRIVTKAGEVKRIDDIRHLVHDTKHGDIFFVSLYDADKKARALGTGAGNN